MLKVSCILWPMRLIAIAIASHLWNWLLMDWGIRFSALGNKRKPVKRNIFTNIDTSIRQERWHVFWLLLGTLTTFTPAIAPILKEHSLLIQMLNKSLYLMNTLPSVGVLFYDLSVWGGCCMARYPKKVFGIENQILNKNRILDIRKSIYFLMSKIGWG